MGIASGLGEKQRKERHLPAHTCTATAHPAAAAHMHRGSGRERGASRRSLGTGQQGGRKGDSLRQEDPSLSPSFPPRKGKNKEDFSVPGYFSHRPWPPLVKPHLKPPRRHGNGPKGTDGPGEPNPSSRGAAQGLWGTRRGHPHRAPIPHPPAMAGH